MSKKMMRRSLALGALMAFVITGSAIAAELNINSEAMYDDWKDGGIDGWGNTGQIANFDSLSGNKITISYDGDYEKVGSVFGAFGMDKNAANNSVSTVTSGSFSENDFYGAVSINGNVTGNKVIINGGKFESIRAFGGAGYGEGVGTGKLNNDITKNQVIVGNDDNVVPVFTGTTKLYGGWSLYDNNVRNNKVVIENGVFEGNLDVYGAYSTYNTNNVEGNEVVIKGGTFKGNTNIYGAHFNNGALMNNNIVSIGGTANFEGVTSIYGASRTGNGNVLNINDGWNGSIKSIKNFNTVNFSKGAKVTVTNGMNLGTGATINLADGDAYTGGNYAINGTLTVNSDEATLTIGNIKEATYNIASGYEGTNKWVLEDALMQVEQEDDGTVTGWDIGANGVKVTVEAKKADQMATDTGMSESTAGLVTEIIQNANNSANTSEQKAAVEFIQNVVDANGSDPTAVGAAINAATKMGEAGGNSATAASIVKNVTGVTNDRLSFNCGHSAPHKGGHGVGLFEEGSGADVWVEYVHGKDKVEDMPSTAGASSYEGQYNGIVMGVDFKKVNKFQSGLAFNYGEGDTNSVGSAARTHSDYDFWGIGYYGSIHNDDSNVIFDIGYAKTDSDVETNTIGINYKASPETTTWTAGVKVEKLYQNENVQIVPYTGLRFMSIDPEDYSTECASSKYQMERQNVWLLPLGVSIKQEVTNDNGWTVSPRVDLSYIWAFGDTDSEMEFSTLGTKTNIGYEVMDDGSFLGLVGIEAHKGQWGFGVSYSYQKGDYSTSKKWFIDANYSF